MKQYAYFTLLVTLFNTSIAHSQEPSPMEQIEVLDKMMNNMAHEMATCSAFFAVMDECVKNTPEQHARIDDGMLETAMQSYNMSDAYHQIAQAKPEVLQARLKTEYQGMMSTIANQCGNISILMAEHLDFCTAAIKLPKSHQYYWLSKLNPNMTAKEIAKTYEIEEFKKLSRNQFIEASKR